MCQNIVINKKRRVLFIVPSLVRAGAETQLVNLINGIDSNKFEKHLISFEKIMDLKDTLDSSVNYHYMPRTRLLDFCLGKDIGIFIDKHEIEIVHASLLIALFMACLGRFFSINKPPIIVAIHTTVNRNLKAEIYDWIIYQWLMRSCKTVVFVCKNQKEHWIKKFSFLANMSHVIYNGIDTDYFSASQVSIHKMELLNSLSIPSNSIIISHIAGFRPEKGHALLLDAFREVAYKLPNVYLIFAGDGELRSEITALVKQKKLMKNIRFLGAVKDVRPILAISDISVIPSSAESFSIAMLESMSMEVPLVAMDVGGTSEAVIPGETGYLVPAKDIRALADSLLNALRNDVQRKMFGLQARNLIKARFTKQVMIKETQSLLIQVIEDVNKN
jgi:glycosyltransferase involved in cell wall biosynthesis